jgi:hypothetical protein
VVEILHVTATGWRGAADAEASVKPEDRDRLRKLATLKPEDRNELRRLAARSALWQFLDAAKKKADVVTWRKDGGPEAEAFLLALDSGGSHPLLEKWRELRKTVAANRSAPDPLDQAASRLSVLMVETLCRAGLGKGIALNRAAMAVNQIFPTTPDAIRGWHRGHPTVTPDDEKLIAGAIEKHGHDYEQIVGWFVGLIRLAIDPIAIQNAGYVLIKKR